MVKPGDVVTVDFPGVTGIKRRPAVVVSTDTYHKTRPDAILGLLTSQVTAATGPTDCWPAQPLRVRCLPRHPAGRHPDRSRPSVRSGLAEGASLLRDRIGRDVKAPGQ